MTVKYVSSVSDWPKLACAWVSTLLCLFVYVCLHLYVLCISYPTPHFSAHSQTIWSSFCLETLWHFSLLLSYLSGDLAGHSPTGHNGDEEVCYPLSKECWWSQLENAVVRSQCTELLREEKLSLRSSGKSNANAVQAQWERGDNEIFWKADIVRKIEIGKRTEVVSDYFSKEQWNTKWVSVWVKQGRGEKEVYYELFTAKYSLALIPLLIVKLSWCAWAEKKELPAFWLCIPMDTYIPWCSLKVTHRPSLDSLMKYKIQQVQRMWSTAEYFLFSGLKSLKWNFWRCTNFSYSLSFHFVLVFTLKMLKTEVIFIKRTPKGTQKTM